MDSRHYRGLLAVLLLAALVVTPVFATGQKDSAAGEKAEKITLMIHPTLYNATGAEEGVIADFTKETGVEVEVVTYSTVELHEKLVLEYTSKTGRYDVATVAVPRLNSEIATFLEPLDSRIAGLDSSFEFDRLIGVSRAKFPPPDGQVHALPFRVGTSMLYYNKELLSNSGVNVPQTFEEYLDAGKKLTTPDVYGIVYRAKGAYMSNETYSRWLLAHGGDYLSPDMTKCIIDSPAGVNALQALVTVAKNGWGPPDVLAFGRDDEIRAMQTGRGAMVITFSPYWSLFIQEGDSEVIGKMAWALVPNSPGVTRGKSQNTGWYVAMDRAGKAKNEAWELMKWLIDPENQLTMAKYGNGPTAGSVYESTEYLEEFPLAKDWLTGLEASVFQPPHPRYAEMEDVIGAEVQSALQGNKTPAQAVKKMANDITELLKQ